MTDNYVYIGGFSYELGEKEQILDKLDELKGNQDQIIGLRTAGFDKYRTCNSSVLELAGKSIDKLFKKISIVPQEIDAVIFATGSFGVNNHLSHSFLCEFLLEFGLTNAYPLTSSLSFCGNYMPALQKAYNSIKTGEFKNVLVVVSDIIPKNSSRLTPPDIAIGSDASSCCLLSVQNFSNFQLNSINKSVDATSGLLDPDKDFLKYVKAVGDGIKDTANKTFSEKPSLRKNVTKVFTNNYSKNICKSYLRLVEISEDKIDLSNIPRFGHAGAADIGINICDYLESNGSNKDDVFLLLSSGPFMWGTALIININKN